MALGIKMWSADQLPAGLRSGDLRNRRDCLSEVDQGVENLGTDPKLLQMRANGPSEPTHRARDEKRDHHKKPESMR